MPTIPIACPGCRKNLQVGDSMLGRWLQCPVCGTGFVPMVDEPDSPAPNFSEEEHDVAAPSQGMNMGYVAGTIVCGAVGLLVVILIVFSSGEKASSTSSMGKKPTAVAQDEGSLPRRVDPRREQAISTPTRIGRDSGERPTVSQAPELPAPVVAKADNPEIARAKTAILNHRWWKGIVKDTDVENILATISAHGEGFVFFNPRGQIAWVSAEDAQHHMKRIDRVELSMAYSLGNRLPEVNALGSPQKVVVLVSGIGARPSRSEAVFLLQDWLNLPDSQELARRNEKDWDSLLNMKKPDQRLQQEREEALRKAREKQRMDIPIIKDRTKNNP